MKFLKADGTVEEGEPLTEEQAAVKQRVEELLHVVVCKYSNHYDWQGPALCREISNKVALGGNLLDALEELKPKPKVAQPVALASSDPEGHQQAITDAAAEAADDSIAL
jgi:hypothetical protein